MFPESELDVFVPRKSLVLNSTDGILLIDAHLLSCLLFFLEMPIPHRALSKWLAIAFDEVMNMPEGQLCSGFKATPGGYTPSSLDAICQLALGNKINSGRTIELCKIWRLSIDAEWGFDFTEAIKTLMGLLHPNDLYTQLSMAGDCSGPK